MTRSKPITVLASVAVIPLIALAVAACGGGSAATAATPNASSGTSATIGVAVGGLGSILVNASGRTLYLFKADSGTMSACTGACATAWPPLLAKGTPTAGTGLTASKLGTITRPGGSHQVTYNGHPLYLFIKDTKAGQATGQGVTAFGAAWFALTPSGKSGLRTCIELTAAATMAASATRPPSSHHPRPNVKSTSPHTAPAVRRPQSGAQHGGRITRRLALGRT